jgi:hypothetical protein
MGRVGMAVDSEDAAHDSSPGYDHGCRGSQAIYCTASADCAMIRGIVS